MRQYQSALHQPSHAPKFATCHYGSAPEIILSIVPSCIGGSAPNTLICGSLRSDNGPGKLVCLELPLPYITISITRESLDLQTLSFFTVAKQPTVVIEIRVLSSYFLYAEFLGRAPFKKNTLIKTKWTFVKAPGAETSGRRNVYMLTARYVPEGGLRRRFEPFR